MLMVGLLCLFVFYPILQYFRNNMRNLATVGNIEINGHLFCMSPLPSLSSIDLIILSCLFPADSKCLN
jgi:hypothetical protein